MTKEMYEDLLERTRLMISELNTLTEEQDKHIIDLEKENATLKKQLEALSGDIPWNELKDVSEVTKELTEAKEIIRELLKYVSDSKWYVQNGFVELQKKLVTNAEAFLKE